MHRPSRKIWDYPAPPLDRLAPRTVREADEWIRAERNELARLANDAAQVRERIATFERKRAEIQANQGFGPEEEF